MVSYYPKIVEELIGDFTKLPGIGQKSAERIVNHLLDDKKSKVIEMAEHLMRLKEDVHLCRKCFNLSDEPICQICKDSRRKNTICVVEEVKDLIVIEKTGFDGTYHVLGGRISTLENMKPGDLRIPELIERVKAQQPDEVIIATNPTAEGEYTAMYISNILSETGVRHSRLAYGLPVGAEIEYVDIQTIKKSIEGRKQL